MSLSRQLLLWQTPRPTVLAERLARSRSPEGAAAVSAGRRLAQRAGIPATLRIVKGHSEDLLLDVQSDPGESSGLELAVSLFAIGYATIELERWSTNGSLADDELLGARAALLAAPAPDPRSEDRGVSPATTAPAGLLSIVSIALLEPIVEGRLTAGLARRGEGPLVVYLAGDVGGIEGRRVAPGPFGREMLVSDARQGPFLVVAAGLPPIDRAGTIGEERSSR